MRAILVCVDYADILRITLPYNLHHFEKVMVVTTHGDRATHEVVWENTRQDRSRVELYCTDSFYHDGAAFNKWKALEEGLDAFGRKGWLCVMDADILWPKAILGSSIFPEHEPNWLQRMYLMTPLRHMWTQYPHNPLPIRYTDMMLGDVRVSAEQDWNEFPLHRQQREFAGYSQIFHADDPALSACANCGWGLTAHRLHGDRTKDGTVVNYETQSCPRFSWHQTNWRHAGGADSFFQGRWPESNKIRPPFKVLHIGPAGVNWCGRVSEMANMTRPKEAQARAEQLLRMMSERRGKPLNTRFDHEKI